MVPAGMRRTGFRVGIRMFRQNNRVKLSQQRNRRAGFAAFQIRATSRNGKRLADRQLQRLKKLFDHCGGPPFTECRLGMSQCPFPDFHDLFPLCIDGGADLSLQFFFRHIHFSALNSHFSTVNSRNASGSGVTSSPGLSRSV